MESHRTMTNGRSRKWIAVILVVAALGCALHPSKKTSLRRTSVVHQQPEECDMNTPRPPTVHDRRKEERDKYIEHFSKTSFVMDHPTNLADIDIPQIKVFKDETINYALWPNTEASVWTDKETVEGFMFVKPKWPLKPVATLTGDFVCFINWSDGVYGHFNNHNLPIIAWLRDQVPQTTKFLLHTTTVARNSIQMLDPEFYERVVWLDWNSTVVIQNGSLTVPTLSSYPMEKGNMRPMMNLRKWVKEKKGTRPKNHVLFYSRRGAAHSRALAHEEEVLKTIRSSMVKYGMAEQELIVFSGKDANGRSLTVEEQYDLFRSAHTVIGPHGAGLLGNLAWIDPFPESCDQRTNVLEFINGDDSKQVQGNFAYISSYFNFRKWPMNYHTLFYTAASTNMDTYIDLWALKDAMSDMWGNRAAITKQGQSISSAST